MKAAPFQEHDRVTRGAEVGVIVLCRNRATGDKFPMVWVLEGPHKGTREYPNRGWMVALDWSYSGLSHVCHECDRPFRTDDTGLTEMPRIWCRECTRRELARGQLEALEAETRTEFQDRFRKRIVTK